MKQSYDRASKLDSTHPNNCSFSSSLEILEDRARTAELCEKFLYHKTTMIAFTSQLKFSHFFHKEIELRPTENT